MTSREATMKLILTFIRLGVIDKPIDFPMFLVLFKDAGRYSEKYGLKEEVESN